MVTPKLFDEQTKRRYVVTYKIDLKIIILMIH